MTESDWIERARAGEVSAFAELFRLHQVRAFRTAYWITGDRALAEDMTQEAFVRAYQAIGRFDPSRPFAPWLMRILINLCRTAMQRRGRQIAVAQLPEKSAEDPGYAAAETKIHVWEALKRLDDIHREVLVLRYYHSFSDVEIAEALDIPIGTAKSRLHKARLLLERSLYVRAGGALSKEVWP